MGRLRQGREEQHSADTQQDDVLEYELAGQIPGDRISRQTPFDDTRRRDHVMAKVTIPISEPMADKIGLNAPATSSAAMPSSTTPRKYASPLKPNTDNHEINGLL